ncbi:MAG TPA: septal ring lytic transglycosylase RlpA family protein [Casimicrobiaceae bacterium]|nr:septal ring lytic transglycosylase RlpA family protein [Casimicrobiaceae bacterium]
MPRRALSWIALSALAAVLAACSSAPPRETPGKSGTGIAKPRYYQDDGPAESVPVDLDAVPDAVPRREPLHRFANKPYSVFGREYVPATSLRPYHERGVASWYGRKFQGQKTAIGETYDMFAMTAAHPTLPLPSFARVTNPANGRSVIVRVNDRGPFLNDRVIDLSYAAAHRLGIAQRGSGEVEVEAVLLDDPLASAAPALPPVLADRAAPVAAALAPMPSIPVVETVPVSVTTSGYVVQLGAFASNPNAQAFAARVANQLPSLGVEAQIRQVNGLFRVFVGPYAAREDARRVADRLQIELGLPSMIAVH